MVNEAEFDHVILWVDESEESQEVKRLLSQTGVEYEEKTIDQSNPDDSIEPPILQAYLYRYSGLTIIQTLAGNPHLSLQRHLDLEKEQYQALVRFEEVSRDRFPNGVSRFWPRWSKRWQPYDPRLIDS